MKIVFTGGHHSSALPVINLIKKFHPEIEILWFGHRHSLQSDRNDTLEYKEITGLGIEFHDLQAGKLYKTYNLKRLFKIPLGFMQSFYWLLKYRPVLIVSFGGYLAVPVVISGWFLGIKSITHEQTQVSGYANRLIALFAHKILISFESSTKYFPKDKVIYTGIPLRESIFQIGDTSLNLNASLPTIYITAGKTGSSIINACVLEALGDLLSFCNVLLQTGDYSKDDFFTKIDSTYQKMLTEAGLKPTGTLVLRKFVMDFEIGAFLNKADLVISRSGAHIISELIALNKPCLLIPIPWVSHDEQNINANYLKNIGSAEILEESNLSRTNLVSYAKNMLNNLPKYSVPLDLVSRMRENASATKILAQIEDEIPRI